MRRALRLTSCINKAVCKRLVLRGSATPSKYHNDKEFSHAAQKGLQRLHCRQPPMSPTSLVKERGSIASSKFSGKRKDATLKEIANLVKEVHPEAKRKGTQFLFALVFPEPRGPLYRRRDIGSVCSGVPGDDDKKSLCDSRMQIGDYLDIAIVYPDSRDSFRDRDSREMFYNRR